LRILLVQPPRRYWPFTSEGDNYLLQQALPALAAPLRDAGHEVHVMDCMPLHIGWRTLADEIKRIDPDVIGCGENHALYASEALRFFQLCKDTSPRSVTVAGGAHFTNLWHRYLGPQSPDRDPERPPVPRDIDVIVIGEGEDTFVDLCRELAEHDPDLGKVAGIAYQEDGEVVRTAPRPLIHNLDALPLPAYDLMPMHLYGTSRYLFSPGGTTIHHSRGCVSKCSFCAWWTTMADRNYDDSGKAVLKPRWRTKSVDRVMEEVELLYHKYGKRSYVWVDESWNIDPRFNEAFADEVLRRGLKISWFAFMRADGIMRDERRGILEKLVASGLSHILIGVERAEDDTLGLLDKRFYQGGLAQQALELFKTKYPQVFLQATFIVGVREENPQSLQKQVDLAKKIDVDFPAFHPITPVPGTPIFDEAIREGWITEDEFDDFDWLTPVLDSKYMSRHEIANALHDMNKQFVNTRWMLRGLFNKTPYKRDMYIWFTKVSMKMAFDAIKERISPLDVSHYQQLVTPEWYEG